MIIIACVDERNGMMFNRRRQSRDSAVCGDILRECGGKKLYMSTYSGKLFGDVEKKNIRITEEFLKEAEEEDFCFIEDIQISGFENKIRTVILYQWNRRYPADRYFLLDLSDGSWELQRTEELKGSSHEKITKGVYERVR